MGRTVGFDMVSRALRLAKTFGDLGISTKEGLERAAVAQHRRTAAATRRDVLKGAGALAAVGLLGLPSLGRAAPKINASVGIVGAGLAGLCAADKLALSGVDATIYEGRDRIGGRQWSMGGAFAGPVMFPGQVVERGGELIDTTHITMKGLAKRFGLKLEDVKKAWLPGETSYYFDGEHVSEEEIVSEFREFVDALRPTMAALTNGMAWNNHNASDVAIDNMTLRDLLEDFGAGHIATKAIDAAYTVEYGREPERQTALAMMFFLHLDKRSRFQPFGVWSDERYHVIGGNQQIAKGLAAGLRGPIELGMRLTAVRKLASGRVQLTFDDSGATVTAEHDAVILTLPFSTLRLVDLHSSLQVPTWQREIIQNFDYGKNTKMNVGFTSRIWGASGSQGDSYSDLPNHQTTWEPNPTNVSNGNAVMLDYSGGERAGRINPAQTDAEAKKWLTDLNKIWPGAYAAAKRTSGGKILAHIQHWPSDEFSRGAYTSNAPGYFTEMEGRVGTPLSSNIFLAGEHTDSFYDWQGFMEGACNSGIKAAGDLVRSL